MKRGIYLVANRKSEAECLNLIYSIRRCGCRLPIRVIPFDDKPIRPDAAWEDVSLVTLEDFPQQGRAFVDELTRRLRTCPEGVVRRFIAWFGEFDEFLYSDNDVVALMNWEELFPYLDEYDIVHADHEFATHGRFNMRKPDRFEELMGPGALENALTAGHFLCRPQPRHKADLLAGLAWMEANPEVPIWHDQALMLVTLTLAKWPALNLCKPPHNWASSWAWGYKNVLEVFGVIQTERRPISHLHYSGGRAGGSEPMGELLLSNLTAKQRRRRLWGLLASEASGVGSAPRLVKRAVRKAQQLARGSN
jgi:hypothetical protein